MYQDQLRKDWHTLQNDFSRLATDVSKIWKRTVGKGKGELQHAMNGYVDRFYEKGRDYIQGRSRRSDIPWKTIGVVTGCGIALAVLIGIAATQTSDTDSQRNV